MASMLERIMLKLNDDVVVNKIKSKIETQHAKPKSFLDVLKETCTIKDTAVEQKNIIEDTVEKESKKESFVGETTVEKESFVDETTVEKESFVDETTVEKESFVDETTVEKESFVDETTVEKESFVDETTVEKESNFQLPPDDENNETSDIGETKKLAYEIDEYIRDDVQPNDLQHVTFDMPASFGDVPSRERTPEPVEDYTYEMFSSDYRLFRVYHDPPKFSIMERKVCIEGREKHHIKKCWCGLCGEEERIFRHEPGKRDMIRFIAKRILENTGKSKEELTALVQIDYIKESDSVVSSRIRSHEERDDLSICCSLSVQDLGESVANEFYASQDKEEENLDDFFNRSPTFSPAPLVSTSSPAKRVSTRRAAAAAANEMMKHVVHEEDEYDNDGLKNRLDDYLSLDSTTTTTTTTDVAVTRAKTKRRESTVVDKKKKKIKRDYIDDIMSSSSSESSSSSSEDDSEEEEEPKRKTSSSSKETAPKKKRTRTKFDGNLVELFAKSDTRGRLEGETMAQYEERRREMKRIRDLRRNIRKALNITDKRVPTPEELMKYQSTKKKKTK